MIISGIPFTCKTIYLEKVKQLSAWRVNNNQTAGGNNNQK
jgi:hypothetical protein